MSDSSPSPKKLRSVTKDVYLIGREYHQIMGSKLPSIKQVLSVLFFNTRTVKLSVRESANLVIDEVLIFWKKARIPPRQTPNCVSKLIKLYEEWDKLHKNCKRQTSTQSNNEQHFLNKLDDLFDIAHANALEIIKISEDREFLIRQREKGRPGCMIGVDESLAQKERRRFKRLQQEEERRARNDAEATKCLSKLFFIIMDYGYWLSINGFYVTVETVVSTETDFSDSFEEHAMRPDIQTSTIVTQTSSQSRGTINFITPRLVAALDNCKVSDRYAVHLISAAAEALGHRVQDLIINRSTIQRCRQENRKATTKKIKQDFMVRIAQN